MFGFALEQNNFLQRALNVASAAYDMESSAVWTQHALAHIHIERGDIDTGISLMNQEYSTWFSSGLRSHMAWHLALFHLEKGNYSEALKVRVRVFKLSAAPEGYAKIPLSRSRATKPNLT